MIEQNELIQIEIIEVDETVTIDDAEIETTEEQTDTTVDTDWTVVRTTDEVVDGDDSMVIVAVEEPVFEPVDETGWPPKDDEQTDDQVVDATAVDDDGMVLMTMTFEEPVEKGTSEEDTVTLEDPGVIDEPVLADDDGMVIATSVEDEEVVVMTMTDDEDQADVFVFVPWMDDGTLLPEAPTEPGVVADMMHIMMAFGPSPTDSAPPAFEAPPSPFENAPAQGAPTLDLQVFGAYPLF